MCVRSRKEIYNVHRQFDSDNLVIHVPFTFAGHRDALACQLVHRFYSSGKEVEQILSQASRFFPKKGYTSGLSLSPFTEPSGKG